MLEESLKNEDDMISSYDQTEELTDPDDDADAVLHDVPYADECEPQVSCFLSSSTTHLSRPFSLAGSMLNPLQDQPQAILPTENPLVAALPYIVCAQTAMGNGASVQNKQSDYHRHRKYRRQQEKLARGQLPLPEIEQKFVGSAKRIKLSTDYTAFTPSQGAYAAKPTGKIPQAKVNPQIEALESKEGFEVLQWTAEYASPYGHGQCIHNLANSITQGRPGHC